VKERNFISITVLFRALLFESQCQIRRSLRSWQGQIRSRGLFFICILVATVAHAQIFTSLVNFEGANGTFPETILQGTDGALWGTTRSCNNASSSHQAAGRGGFVRRP
jgi:hypothetical protein